MVTTMRFISVHFVFQTSNYFKWAKGIQSSRFSILFPLSNSFVLLYNVNKWETDFAFKHLNGACLFGEKKGN